MDDYRIGIVLQLILGVSYELTSVVLGVGGTRYYVQHCRWHRTAFTSRQWLQQSR